MGVAASVGTAAAVKVTPDKDLLTLLAALPADDRKKLLRALDPEVPAAAADDAKKTPGLAVPPLPTEQVSKFHSAIRWGKTPAEVKELVENLGIDLHAAISAEDPKNGNRCLHVAAQNGHMQLSEFIVGSKAEINARNKKGQTALHMSIEYDFYFQSKMLMSSGADPKIENGDGHAAITGIDGGKTGKEAWDNPVIIVKGANDNPEEIEFAFSTLESADPATIDKGLLAQTGMMKKKTCKTNWDAKRFLGIMQKL